LTYADTSNNFISSYIVIEIRGSYSQSFPKKSYDIEFRTDDSSGISQDVTLGNLRTDDDWELEALYNEPLRINNYISHKLWLNMYVPSYLNKEPDAKAGSDVNYSELFLNGRYNGIYLIMEPIDRKLLQLKKPAALL
jgi:spore coat protein H